MRAHVVTAALLGVSIVLVAWRPIPAQEPRPAESSKAPAPKLNDDEEAISTAVNQLVEQLRLHPPQPSTAADRVAGLYMVDVFTGEVTLIADQPDANTTFCGSAAWSSDGKRILFDAMRPEEVARAHMKAIELVAGKLTMTDLGVGNCPTFSPARDQIAFLLNSGGVPGAQGGLWLMKPDGSERHRLGPFGRPEWSPDGRQFMLVGFAIPAHVTLLDVGSEMRRPVQIRGLQIHSVPHWASAGTIVAVVGSDFGDSIALIDVTDPAQGKVKEILWKTSFKGQGPDVQPCAAVYRPSSGRCVFVGKGTVPGTAGMALYSFERGRAVLPKRVEREGVDSLMQDLALSPDGRYVLFTSNRAGPRQRGSAPRALAPGPKGVAEK